jgi:hypothetical protein
MLSESMVTGLARVLTRILRRFERPVFCARADMHMATSKINPITPFRYNAMPFSYKCPKIAFIA